MNPTRASRRIRSLSRAGRWEILSHAVERMIERGVTVEDVKAVLTGAESCRAAGKRLIVELAGDVLVVTLFRGDE